MVTPETLILAVPGVAVIVPPTQEIPTLRPLGVAITSGDGSVSVNPTPVRATGFGLLIVKDRLDVVFFSTTSGMNAFVKIGGPKTTMGALAVPPVPPSIEVIWPVTFG